MKSILGNTRRPDVTFHRDGRIDITARVGKGLSLRDGDIIDIAEENGEYLLVKKNDGSVVGNHEARCHSTKKGKRHANNMRVYSKRLCDFMLRLSSAPAPLRVPVGDVVSMPDGRSGMPVVYRYNIEKKV